MKQWHDIMVPQLNTSAQKLLKGKEVVTSHPFHFLWISPCSYNCSYYLQVFIKQAHLQNHSTFQDHSTVSLRASLLKLEQATNCLQIQSDKPRINVWTIVSEPDPRKILLVDCETMWTRPTVSKQSADFLHEYLKIDCTYINRTFDD